MEKINAVAGKDGVGKTTLTGLMIQYLCASGKTELESRMRFRREGVPMGLPGLDEWHIQQTSQEAVAAARKALDE